VTGLWIGASYVLGRPVRFGEPYPHICGVNVAGRMSSRRVLLWKRDCAACVQEQHEQEYPPPIAVDELPAVDPDITAAEHRRVGDKD
jgi:hypothetical protein